MVLWVLGGTNRMWLDVTYCVDICAGGGLVGPEKETL